MTVGPTRYRALLLAAVLLPGTAGAQSGSPALNPLITRILDTPPAPVVLLNPGRTRLLILEPALRPSASDPAPPELALAGLRINPRNTAPTNLPTYTAVVARPIGRGETRRIVIPWQARVAHPTWSPEGDKIAFTVVEDAGISLWVAEAWSGESRMLAGPALNGVFGNPCQWLPSGSGLVCAKAVPPRLRDQSPVERHFTSQLAVIPLSGPERPVGDPGIHPHVDLSPDGRYLLVESLHPALSDSVPSHRLPVRTEVWDLTGTVLKVVGDRGVIEAQPPSADEVPKGPRSFGWRGDQPATLVWLEAQDGGDPAAAAAVRDRMVQLDAPFSGTPATVLEVKGRIQETVWGRGDLAVVTEGWSGTGHTRTWIIDPGAAGGAPKLFSERSSDDRYADPGRFLTRRGPRGRPVLHTSQDGRFAFLAGVRASPLGELPFLDRLALATRKRSRMWQSQGAYYEVAIAILDQAGEILITRRESVNEPPNYFIRDLRKPGAGRSTAVTEFQDPSPEFSGITRQLITFKRRDGVLLSGLLYLPPGYRPAQGRLPFLLWVTPAEFRSQASALRLPGSPYRFTRPTDLSPLIFLFNGYGVLELPSLPTGAGAASAPGDGSLQKLVLGATAAVEKLGAMGVADSKRIGVGGYSGAGNAAADLLQHSDLFQAGITEAAAEGDGAGHTVLIQPPDATRRPLLTLTPWGGPNRTRESLGKSLAEMTSWMDKYLKGDPVRGRP
jgi:dipeptidyl aminopeptidase/acylaminoacyl peptidase